MQMSRAPSKPSHTRDSEMGWSLMEPGGRDRQTEQVLGEATPRSYLSDTTMWKVKSTRLPQTCSFSCKCVVIITSPFLSHGSNLYSQPRVQWHSSSSVLSLKHLCSPPVNTTWVRPFSHSRCTVGMASYSTPALCPFCTLLAKQKSSVHTLSMWFIPVWME